MARGPKRTTVLGLPGPAAFTAAAAEGSLRQGQSRASCAPASPRALLLVSPASRLLPSPPLAALLLGQDFALQAPRIKGKEKRVPRASSNHPAGARLSPARPGQGLERAGSAGPGTALWDGRVVGGEKGEGGRLPSSLGHLLPSLLGLAGAVSSLGNVLLKPSRHG